MHTHTHRYLKTIQNKLKYYCTSWCWMQCVCVYFINCSDWHMIATCQNIVHTMFCINKFFLCCFCVVAFAFYCVYEMFLLLFCVFFFVEIYTVFWSQLLGCVCTHVHWCKWIYCVRYKRRGREWGTFLKIIEFLIKIKFWSIFQS